jgi:SAM-dependent methyltransferase
VSGSIWAAGELYEPYIGRWSREVGRRFVSDLAVPPGARWVDVGCGTGALTATILEGAEPAAVVGVEPAPGFLDFARTNSLDPRASFLPGDAAAIPLPDGSADIVVSGLVLNFVPDPAGALLEMRRVARAGGRIAAYVWDYARGMELIRTFWDAAIALDPGTRSLDEGVRFPLCAPRPLKRLLEEAGMTEVQTGAIVVPTRFRDFDDYWEPFLGAQGPAPAYVASLDEAERQELRELLRTRLSAAADDSITLSARAWTVSGTSP